MHPSLSLRAITPNDMDFLFRLYASTRETEMTQFPWSLEQKTLFLQQQFMTQHQQYQAHYPAARFDLIELDDQAVGRLYVQRDLEDIRIIDISLLHEYRNQGIGERLLREILAEGAAASKTVSLQVRQDNPALRLYQRLGFHKVADNGPYQLMQWQPDMLES